LPLALLVCAQAGRADWLRSFGVAPPVLATGFLLYGLWQMRSFQPQERIWTAALWRAQLFATVNMGLSPFLYWWSQMPGNSYFLAAAVLFALSSIAFLASLNLTIERLGAMLPDETLRYETRQFTAVNRWLLFVLLVLLVLVLGVSHWPVLAGPLGRLLSLLAHPQASRVLLIVFLLLPVAMTMALLWKTKEVILHSVFGGEH
jgi:hypothetical protein